MKVEAPRPWPEEAGTEGTVPSANTDPGWVVNLEAGEVMAPDRYERLRLVAVGGGGRVFQAWDRLLEREVALKFHRWETPAQRESLLREARAQARVKHPGICPIFDVGEQGGDTYLAMQWISGPKLKELLPRLTRRQRFDLLIQACQAVHAAHLQGLVHLDLKPSNLLLEELPGGEWKILISDFGLAMESGLQAGGRRGTPPFASPEQWSEDGGRLGPRSDVYALGVLMHWLLAGELPREDDTRLKGRTREVFARATAMEAGQRHPTAQALAGELQALMDSRPLPGRPASSFQRLALWSIRHRYAVIALVPAVLVTGFLLTQSMRSALRNRSEKLQAQRFGQEIERLGMEIRMHHLAPGADPQGILDRTDTQIRAIQAALPGMEAQGQAAAEFALGKAYQLEGDDGAALRYLESAWNKGYQTPDCALALGLLRCGTYLDQIRKIGISLREDPNAPEVQELRKRYALPAAEILSKGAPEGTETYVVLAALRSELEGKSKEAESLATAALSTPSVRPWEVQPWVVLASYWEDHAQYAIALEKYAQARTSLDKAWAAQRRGVEAVRGDPSLHMTGGWLHLTQAHLAELEGHLDEADSELRHALDGFTLAQRYQPSFELAEKYVLDTLRRMLVLQRQHQYVRLDASTSGREAVAQALEAFPTSRAISKMVVRLRRELYFHDLLASKGTPRPGEEREIRTALASVYQAEELPYQLVTFDLDLARCLMRKGGNPMPCLERARRVLDAQPGLVDADADLFLQSCDWLILMSQFRLRRGEAPDASALQTKLERARALQPTHNAYMIYEWRPRMRGLEAVLESRIKAKPPRPPMP